MLNICAAVLLCGCYNSMRLPDGGESDVKPNTTLAELRGLWHGATFEVTKPMVVSGVVTSSDRAGNFYHTFTIADETAAAEIRAGMRDLHNPYPIGCRLWVRLEGCAVGVERGVLQIGLLPESYSNYTVDYFYSKVLLDRHIVRCGDVAEVTPTKMEYDDLRVDMCGSLVRVEGVQLQPDLPEQGGQPEQGDPQPAKWTGYRTFADADGNRLYTHTSNYADFAAKEVPTTPCDITGILQYDKIAGVDGECFILKMRSIDDCTPSIDRNM